MTKIIFFNIFYLFLNSYIQYFEFASKKNYVQALPIDGFSLEMVYIPNGSFDMGKDSTKSMDYSPSNKIELSPFWISKYEITWIFINYLWIRQILMKKKILKGLTS